MISRPGLAAAGLAAVVAASTSSASPRPLPFTYTYDTLAQGETEVEVYTDLTPAAAQNAGTGATERYMAPTFQAEFEYGITNRLELGLYATVAPSAGDAFINTAETLEGNGAKQRLRLRLADEGRWPIDVGLYGEVVETDRRIELEAKVILAHRFGNLRLVANLVAEYEFYYNGQRDLEFFPSAGLTYQFTPLFHLGLEYWMHVEFPDPAPAQRVFNIDVQQYVGPTVLLNFGRLWWSTGIYARVGHFGYDMLPGDLYGEVWGRTIIGINL